MSKKDRYFISTIYVNMRHDEYDETSYEIVSDEMYNKFLALKNKVIYIEEPFGKHSSINVEYDDNEWKIKEITGEKEIEEFLVLYKNCKTFDRIENCIEQNTE